MLGFEAWPCQKNMTSKGGGEVKKIWCVKGGGVNHKRIAFLRL